MMNPGHGTTGVEGLAAAEHGGLAPNGSSRPDSQVLRRSKRRSFSAAYKLRIVQEAEACREAGAIAALLRREGLYSSHLTDWRRACQEGSLQALAKERGPQGRRRDAVAVENERLRQENARLQRRLQQAEAIVAIQKKASELLGIPLSRPDSDDDA